MNGVRASPRPVFSLERYDWKVGFLDYWKMGIGILIQVLPVLQRMHQTKFRLPLSSPSLEDLWVTPYLTGSTGFSKSKPKNPVKIADSVKINKVSGEGK